MNTDTQNCKVSWASENMLKHISSEIGHFFGSVPSDWKDKGIQETISLMGFGLRVVSNYVHYSIGDVPDLRLIIELKERLYGLIVRYEHDKGWRNDLLDYIEEATTEQMLDSAGVIGRIFNRIRQRTEEIASQPTALTFEHIEEFKNIWRRIE